MEGRSPFEVGKGSLLRKGSDITLVACGLMVEAALKAAELLAQENIGARVINMATVKPLDESLLIAAAAETRGLVVCEEHSVAGGLAGAVAETLAEKHPAKVLRIGVRNRFGQSGDEKDLLKEYGLTCAEIVASAKKLL
jgi:transketolase